MFPTADHSLRTRGALPCRPCPGGAGRRRAPPRRTAKRSAPRQQGLPGHGGRRPQNKSVAAPDSGSWGPGFSSLQRRTWRGGSGNIYVLRYPAPYTRLVSTLCAVYSQLHLTNMCFAVLMIGKCILCLVLYYYCFCLRFSTFRAVAAASGATFVSRSCLCSFWCDFVCSCWCSFWCDFVVLLSGNFWCYLF